MTPEQQRIALAEWAGEENHPDYLNDLNAVHELEKKLTEAQWPFYVTLLCGITCDRDGEGLVHATAAQRCEALLKTLNLWTP